MTSKCRNIWDVIHGDVICKPSGNDSLSDTSFRIEKSTSDRLDFSEDLKHENLSVRTKNDSRVRVVSSTKDDVCSSESESPFLSSFAEFPSASVTKKYAPNQTHFAFTNGSGLTVNFASNRLIADGKSPARPSSRTRGLRHVGSMTTWKKLLRQSLYLRRNKNGFAGRISDRDGTCVESFPMSVPVSPKKTIWAIDRPSEDYFENESEIDIGFDLAHVCPNDLAPSPWFPEFSDVVEVEPADSTSEIDTTTVTDGDTSVPWFRSPFEGEPDEEEEDGGATRGFKMDRYSFFNSFSDSDSRVVGCARCCESSERRELNSDEDFFSSIRSNSCDKYSNLSDKYSNSCDKYSNLSDKYSNLSDKYSNSCDKYSNLSDKYSNSCERHSNSRERHSNLRDKYSISYDKYADLCETYSELCKDYSNPYKKCSDVREKRTLCQSPISSYLSKEQAFNFERYGARADYHDPNDGEFVADDSLHSEALSDRRSFVTRLDDVAIDELVLDGRTRFLESENPYERIRRSYEVTVGRKLTFNDDDDARIFERVPGVSSLIKSRAVYTAPLLPRTGDENGFHAVGTKIVGTTTVGVTAVAMTTVDTTMVSHENTSSFSRSSISTVSPSNFVSTETDGGSFDSSTNPRIGISRRQEGIQDDGAGKSRTFGETKFINASSSQNEEKNGCKRRDDLIEDDCRVSCDYVNGNGVAARVNEIPNELPRPAETSNELQRPTETPNELQRPTETPNELQRPTETPNKLQRPTETPNELPRPTEMDDISVVADRFFVDDRDYDEEFTNTDRNPASISDVDPVEKNDPVTTSDPGTGTADDDGKNAETESGIFDDDETSDASKTTEFERKKTSNRSRGKKKPRSRLLSEIASTNGFMLEKKQEQHNDDLYVDLRLLSREERVLRMIHMQITKMEVKEEMTKLKKSKKLKDKKLHQYDDLKTSKIIEKNECRISPENLRSHPRNDRRPKKNEHDLVGSDSSVPTTERSVRRIGGGGRWWKKNGALSAWKRKFETSVKVAEGRSERKRKGRRAADRRYDDAAVGRASGSELREDEDEDTEEGEDERRSESRVDSGRVFLPVPLEVKRLVTCHATGETVLHKAARLGYDGVALWCCQTRFVEVDATDNAGYTALHETCLASDVVIARHLLRYGANVNAVSQRDGRRPLHEAVDADSVEMARLLLSFGANVNLTTYSGKTMEEMARSNAMRKFLTDYVADINGIESKEVEWHLAPDWNDVAQDSTTSDIFSDVPSTPTRQHQITFECSNFPF